jgi:hypothetical protein
MAVANALGYYDAAIITAIISFIEQAPGLFAKRFKIRNLKYVLKFFKFRCKS